jgi:hypothetical protein
MPAANVTADGPIPAPDDAERTLTGWEYQPQALRRLARRTRPHRRTAPSRLLVTTAPARGACGTWAP